MALTPRQLQIIQAIIARYHQAFVVNWISPSAVPADVLAELKRRGMVNPQAATIEESYTLGQAIERASSPQAQGMSFAAFQEAVRKMPIALTQPEQHAVTLAEQRAAQLIVGLGNRIDTQTGQVLIEADQEQRRELRQKVNEKVVEAVEQRLDPKRLKSELGWAIQDWTRDLNRIALTEKHTAMETGKADYYAATTPGGDPDVAILAAPNCCELCASLTRGPDGAPRIFKLSELEANGTNVGRKAAQARPVTGSIHPNCVCKMARIPAGWGFDETFDLVPDGQLGVRANAEHIRRSVTGQGSLRKALAEGSTACLPGITVQLSGPVRYGPVPFAPGAITAGGQVLKCLVGQDYAAPMAWVAHRSGRDQLLLGFSTLSQALQADSAYTAIKGMVLPASRASEVPMAALASWAARPGPTPTMVLKRAIDSAGYEVSVEDVDGTGSLASNPTLGAGSLGTNKEFGVPTSKRPAGANTDPTGLLAFIRQPQQQMVANPVRRTKEDYEVQVYQGKRDLPRKTQAVPPLSESQRQKDTEVARQGLEHQIAARYGGWLGQDARFVIRDLAGVVQPKAAAKRAGRKPVKKAALGKAG